MNLADAMALLQEQGFEPNTSVPQFIWGLFTATRTDPEDGTMLDRGAKVRVFASE